MFYRHVEPSYFIQLSFAWSNEDDTRRELTRVAQQMCQTLVNSHRNFEYAQS